MTFNVNSPGHVVEHNRLAGILPDGTVPVTSSGLDAATAALIPSTSGSATATQLSATYVRHAPAPTGNPSIDGPALTALNIEGSRIILQSGVYALNAPLSVLPGVRWEGVEPSLRQVTTTTGLWLADGVWDYESGTVLQGDGTFAAFEANVTDSPTIPSNLGDLEIPNFGALGIGFDNFTYGIHIGAQNVMGWSHGRLDRLFFKNCSIWAVCITNFAHVTIGDMRACASGGGFYFGANIPASTFQPGNSRMGELYVYTQNGVAGRRSRGIVFDVRNGGSLNHLDCQRLQVNRYSVTELSVSAAFTSGSQSVTVPDGTQFDVGMPVVFTTTGNGFTGGRAYVVRSVSGNTLTLSESTFGTVITASGTGSLTLTTYGYANVEFLGDSTSSQTTTSIFHSLDVEGSTTVGVFAERILTSSIGIPVAPTGSLVDVALRSVPSSLIISPTPLVVDVDDTSTTSTYNGAIKTWLWRTLRGIAQDTGRGVFGFNIGPTGVAQPPNLEIRSGGFVYPNTGMGESVYSRDAALTLTGNQGGDVVFAGTSATTMTLPTIVSDATPVNSHIGLWFDFINVSAFTLTISTDGTQTFNKIAGRTSITVAAGQSCKVMAVKDASGNLFWVAKAPTALAS